MTTTAYPLYDELYSSIFNRKNDEKVDVRKVASTINQNIDSEHKDEIYALMLHHHYNKTGKFNPLPYGITSMPGGRGVLVKMNGLPEELQLILAEYIMKYSKK
jgi:hypothetical protein